MLITSGVTEVPVMLVADTRSSYDMFLNAPVTLSSEEDAPARSIAELCGLVNRVKEVGEFRKKRERSIVTGVVSMIKSIGVICCCVGVGMRGPSFTRIVKVDLEVPLMLTPATTTSYCVFR